MISSNASKFFRAAFLCLFTAGSLATLAQQTDMISNTVVPTLVEFSGVLTSSNGKPLTGITGVTFSLYAEQEGGAPLWMETQNVQPNANGQYTVMLGSTASQGLPTSLFSSGEARWLGVQVQGQAEQPRVMLLSVPYAMKAGDATTVGGLPASAFVKANSTSSGQSAGKNANPATETQSYIPVFVNSSGGLGNSILYQSGTTEVGIGTTTPAATLEVNGTGKFDGLVNFAASQTFPGTLTGITAGTGITVSGSKSAPTVGINTTFANEYYAQLGAANTFTKNQTVSASLTAQQLVSTAAQGTAPLQVTSTTQVPNLNASQLGGLASSAFAQLGAASNTFTGSLTASSFSGSGSGLTNVTAANSNELGGLAPSAFAQLGAASNTFTGSLTASSFTGSGSGLTNVTAVNSNELGGLLPSAFAQLRAANTFTGNQTVSGAVAATSFSGNGAGLTNVNAAALGGVLPGAFAQVAAANTFTANQTISGKLGIGTSAVPVSSLEIDVLAAGSLGPTVSLVNTGAGAGSEASLDLYTDGQNQGMGPTSRILAIDDGNYDNTLTFSVEPTDFQADGLFEVMRMVPINFFNQTDSMVGINTCIYGSPCNYPISQLEVDGGFYEGESGPFLTLTNVSGGTGYETAVDFNTYPISGRNGTYNPSARIAAVDAGGFTDNIVFQVNKSGSPNNGLQSVMTITPQGNLDIVNSLNVPGLVTAIGGFSGQCLYSGFFDLSGSNACNMDLAEAYASTQRTEPGDLVSLVPGDEATVRKSSRGYEPLLLGVVSTNPGLVFDNGKTHLAGDNSVVASEGKAVIALAGRVPVKVSMENGHIRVGDPLTSSSHAGVAMKATAAGKIIGYALAPATKNGKVLMFVQPGYYAAPQLASLQSKLTQLDRENRKLRQENASLHSQFAEVLAQVKQIRAKLDDPETHTALVVRPAGR